MSEPSSSAAPATSPVVKTLTLEPIEVNLFRGFNPQWGGPRIFGGQVIAQALMAAYQTVDPKRFCHSLQSYFIRPGDSKAPVLYEVERSRDGSSFSTRRVKAIQHGEQIFNLNCSFQIDEKGLEHERPMPDVPPPESVRDEEEHIDVDEKRAPQFVRNVMDAWPVEQRPIDPLDMLNPTAAKPHAHTWFRAMGDVPTDVPMNQAVLAYASDFSLLSTSMRPHRVNWNMGQMQTASLDHIMWFHRPSLMTDWHLYEQISPSASGGRGMNYGFIYTRDGKLVATVAQEGLIRVRAPAKS